MLIGFAVRMREEELEISLKVIAWLHRPAASFSLSRVLSETVLGHLSFTFLFRSNSSLAFRGRVHACFIPSSVNARGVIPLRGADLPCLADLTLFSLHASAALAFRARAPRFSGEQQKGGKKRLLPRILFRAAWWYSRNYSETESDFRRRGFHRFSPDRLPHRISRWNRNWSSLNEKWRLFNGHLSYCARIFLQIRIYVHLKLVRPSEILTRMFIDTTAIFICKFTHSYIRYDVHS